MLFNHWNLNFQRYLKKTQEEVQIDNSNESQRSSNFKCLVAKNRKISSENASGCISRALRGVFRSERLFSFFSKNKSFSIVSMETVLFLLIQLRFTHQRNGTLFIYSIFSHPFYPWLRLFSKIFNYTVFFFNFTKIKEENVNS